MFFLFDPTLSELPAYVAIASSGRTVLSHAHYEAYADAVAWCARAMKQVPGADQLSIARPTVLHWQGFGKMPGVMPVEGWIRHEGAWQQADARLLLRTFEGVEDGPHTLLTEPPTSPAPEPAAPPAPVVRFAPPQRATLVEVLRELTQVLARLADRQEGAS